MSDGSERRIKRVLVVDDDDLSQELMAAVLGEIGYVYEAAHNGQEAVEKALRGDFDLVLMDLRMPMMGGYTAAKQIHEVKKDLPIIALSAYAVLHDPSRCQDAGISKFISKPIDVAELKEWIQTA